ncbi:MAG: hypothetical protein NZ932_05825 [Candidatus Bathyarchaeota archaeon]|nr:hypothetical protein [Candidatus Bathyarchaeota archaeon]
MKGQNSGQIRVIEAFLAIFIIFSVTAISTNLATKSTRPTNNGLAALGMQALLQLDSDGSLGAYIAAGNWSGLRETLNLLLPVGVSFNLTVYDNEMRQVNTETVSNGGFNSQEVTLVKYVCASQNPEFSYYVVYLYLAVAK